MSLAYDYQFRFKSKRFTYARMGSGPVLVLLHGAGGSAMWESQAKELAKSFDVIVPRHPGYDDEPCPSWLEGVDDLAYLYLEAFEELGIENPILLGHSLGGWIAAEMAIRQPKSIRALILVSSAGLEVDGVAPGNNFIWSMTETAENLFYQKSNQDAFLKANQDETVALQIYRARETTARLAWSPRWIGPAITKWIDRIDMPAFVIWGSDDKLFPAAFGREFAARLPDSDYLEISECRHVPHLDQPETFTRAVSEFLENLQ